MKVGLDKYITQLNHTEMIWLGGKINKRKVTEEVKWDTVNNKQSVYILIFL